ncbi:MAG: hypothetical protein ACM3IJ_00730 [Candidatus Levyibacteriota bacterium]
MANKKEFSDEEVFEGKVYEEDDISEIDREIIAGEWENLTNNETYRKRSRSGRIIAMHQAISNRIKQLEKLFYQLVRDHPEKSEKMLARIKRLRFLQQYLLQAYAWEEQGELYSHPIPEELEGLI